MTKEEQLALTDRVDRFDDELRALLDMSLVCGEWGERELLSKDVDTAEMGTERGRILNLATAVSDFKQHVMDVMSN